MKIGKLEYKWVILTFFERSKRYSGLDETEEINLKNDQRANDVWSLLVSNKPMSKVYVQQEIFKACSEMMSHQVSVAYL